MTELFTVITEPIVAICVIAFFVIAIVAIILTTRSITRSLNLHKEMANLYKNTAERARLREMKAEELNQFLFHLFTDLVTESSEAAVLYKVTNFRAIMYLMQLNRDPNTIRSVTRLMKQPNTDTISDFMMRVITDYRGSDTLNDTAMTAYDRFMRAIESWSEGIKKVQLEHDNTITKLMDNQPTSKLEDVSKLDSQYGDFTPEEIRATTIKVEVGERIRQLEEQEAMKKITSDVHELVNAKADPVDTIEYCPEEPMQTTEVEIAIRKDEEPVVDAGDIT